MNDEADVDTDFGAPGTGKTYLARQLAEALPVVVLEKDVIKETLFDAVGEGDREWSKKLGGATFALLRTLVESQLKAGQSVVVESTFQPEHDAPWLDRVRSGSAWMCWNCIVTPTRIRRSAGTLNGSTRTIDTRGISRG